MEVSSLVMAGPAVSLSRRSHLTFMLPSKPGNEEPDRIAVRGAHALAVLVEAHERVIHRLGERDAAAHAGGIGALGDHPARRRIDAGLIEQRREPYAGPFRAAEEAVDRGHAERLRLRRVERALLPAHSMKAMRDSIG